VDSAPDTLNIDPDAIAKAVTPRTKAIIPVHFAGQPCDMKPILAIGRAQGLKIIEDAAHALPAADGGQAVGTIGDVTCFSFYATKTITTGEGGMATTENSEWAAKMRMLSLHGISHDAWKRYSAEGSWYYEVTDVGYKYNLTDIAASLGLAQLKKCHGFAAARRRIAETYTAAFANLPEIHTPVCRPDKQHAWHLYVIQLDLDRLSIGRNQFVEALKEQKIGTSVHFIPLHRHPYYRDRFGYRMADFPNAAWAYERMISLPIYPKMTAADVEDVICAVTRTVEKYRR
jgi:perosamine synthetase